MASLDALDRANPQKLYCQLASVLKARVEEGQWEVGSRIPTEEELCRQYDVSKATVRLAVDELVSLGYLKKFQGKGTFVRRRTPERRIALLTSLAEDGSCSNPSCTARLVECSVVVPPQDVRAELNLGDDDECQYISSLTIELNAPHLLRKAYLPRTLLPSPMGRDDAQRAAREGVFELVESRCGLKIHRVRETIDVVAAEGADAAHLQVASGTPALRARHLCAAFGGIPVLFSESLHRTGARARTVELERLTP